MSELKEFLSCGLSAQQAVDDVMASLKECPKCGMTILEKCPDCDSEDKRQVRDSK